MANDICHIFPVLSYDSPVVYTPNENGEKTIISSISTISLRNLETLVINGDEFPIIGGGTIQWLDMGNRFTYLKLAGRCAFHADICPVLVNKIPDAERIEYTYNGVRQQLRIKNGNQWGDWVRVQDNLLWCRGTIEVYRATNLLYSYTIIFVDVDFGNFNNPIIANDNPNIESIKYKTRDGQIHSPNIRWQNGDSYIQFEVEGFKVQRAIDYIGVFFETPIGKGIALLQESEDWREAIPIAMDDIRDLPCKVIIPQCDDVEVLLIRGNKMTHLKSINQEKLRMNHQTTFHWRNYEKSFEEQNNSPYFSVCIKYGTNVGIYKFKAFNPIEQRYTQPHFEHTVLHKLGEDGTLEIRHYLPYSKMANSANVTLFLCCPIDQLDNVNGFREMKCECNYLAGEVGHIGEGQEIIKVSNFAHDNAESLRSGCLCFLAKKLSYINGTGFEYRLVSSGFFVQSGQPIVYTESQDILQNLKQAMITKNLDALKSLLQTESQEAKGFLDRIWNNISNIRVPEIRDYLNLYSSISLRH